MNGLERLTPSQQYLYNLVKSTSKQRAQKVLEGASLTQSQLYALNEAKEKIQDSRIVQNIDLSEVVRGVRVIDGLFEAGRLFNRIEIGNFPGGIHNNYFRTRLMVEFKIYGAKPELQFIFAQMSDSERPVYGGLDYIRTASSIPSLAGYGHYRFVFKEETKSRSTFTPYDSFWVRRNQVFIYDDIDAVLATKVRDRYWFELINESSEPYDPETGGSYVESQVLGNVKLSDIEKLYYPSAMIFDRVLFKKLRRLEDEYGIELIQY